MVKAAHPSSSSRAAAAILAAASLAIFLGLGVYGFLQDLLVSAILRANGSTHTAFSEQDAISGAVARAFGAVELNYYLGCLVSSALCIYRLRGYPKRYWAIVFTITFLIVGVVPIVFSKEAMRSGIQVAWLTMHLLRAAVCASCFVILLRPIQTWVGTSEEK